MNTAFVFIGIVLLVLCWLGWQLLQQNGRLLLRIESLEERLNEIEFGDASEPEGLPVGSVAPEFELPDLTGERRTLAQFRAQPLLLIFFNPDCGYCRELVPKLAALESCSRRGNEAEVSAGKEARLLTSAATNSNPLLLIITAGDAEQNRQFFREHKITSPVLLQKDGEVATAYRANGTPTGYLINSEGRIASELAVGAEALLALANGKAQLSTLGTQPADSRASRFGNRSLARSKLARNGLKAGTPAPPFRLPRLEGGELALEELRGSRVLLVFSDPHCGPCDALAPRLEIFHRESRANARTPSPQPSPPGEGERLSAVEVVMVSRGEPKANRAKVKEHGLTFPVVLQQQWEISRRYAMFATPIAYLIDAAGVITHDVAVGEDAILNLLAAARSPAAVTEL